MGLFGGLVNTWKDGYQFGDIIKSALYDLNPIAWAGDALAHIGDKDFNFFENNPNWTPSSEDPIHQGIVNTWNKFTGNAHLTPEYQHEEQMEMNKNQITANDLQKAGISKYAMSPVGFSAPSTTGKGGDMLQAILATQQIASQAQALKEQKYNYKVSKKLGIRTGDANALAQYLPLIKILTGKDLSDIPDGGLFGLLKDTLFPSGSDSNVVNSASIDVPSLPELTSSLALKPSEILSIRKDTSAYDSARYSSSLSSIVDMYVNDGLLGWNGKSVVYDDFSVYKKIVSSIEKQYNIGRNDAIHVLDELVQLAVEGSAGNSSHVPVSGAGYAGGGGYAW